MSAVPHQWPQKPLGAITKVEWGNTSITKASYVESGFPAFSATGCDGFLPSYEWQGPAVVLSAIGARCGKCFLAEDKWTAIKNTIVIQGNDDAFSHRFLFYYLNDASRWKISGSGQPFITLKTARETPIPAPLPDEQRRIVAEIEKQFTRLETGVAALRRVQANLKRYRAAVLKAACEGHLVPTEAELHRKLKTKSSNLETGAQLLARILTERRQNWQGRGKYKEPAAPDTTNLPTLPEEWTWATVEQLGRIETGSTPPKADANNYGDEIPLVKPGELLDHPVSEAADNLTQLGAAVATTAPANSVLVSCIGNLGKTALTVREVAFNQQINAIIPTLTATARWIFYSVQQGAFRQQLESVASATTISIVNKSKFSALIVPLPPLAEQTRIVAEVERRLSVVEELESVVTANLQRATRLRQSILQKAFTGQL